MGRNRIDQVPLGELLTQARLAKGLARAHVAKEAGIAENSLAKYEKAGLEADGQYPPAPKLAKLCFVLEISPMRAFLACLTKDDYWRFQQSEFPLTDRDDLGNHPKFQYLADQLAAVVDDCSWLRQALKLALADPAKLSPNDAERRDDLLNRAREIDALQKQFEAGLKAAFKIKEVEWGDFISFPGPSSHPIWAKGDPFDYAALKSGSDHKDPSRPSSDNVHSQAAPTASSKRSGRKDRKR